MRWCVGLLSASVVVCFYLECLLVYVCYLCVFIAISGFDLIVGVVTRCCGCAVGSVMFVLCLVFGCCFNLVCLRFFAGFCVVFVSSVVLFKLN